ncbi:MAG: hypothetical protein U0936_12945 [Planctomycetaceae bacterium]
MFSSSSVLLKSSSAVSRRIAVSLLLGLCMFVGCGEQRAAPVDPVLAKKSLVEVMEHWKSGGAIEALRKRQPEIVAQEMWWSQGRKLIGFQLVGEGRVEDANWFCDVELEVSDGEGKEPVKKTFTYVVGTDPVITVFRAIL